MAANEWDGECGKEVVRVKWRWRTGKECKGRWTASEVNLGEKGTERLWRWNVERTGVCVNGRARKKTMSELTCESERGRERV